MTAPSPESASPWSTALRLAARTLMIVAVALMLWWLWSSWDHEAFVRWKEQAGPVPYFLAMALLPALGLPVTPFFILAGATFGVRIGLTGSLLALLVNFTLCYWLARSHMRPVFVRVLGRFQMQLPDFDGQRSRALRFLWLVKLAPGVPAFAKNYLLGLSGVPFGLYLGVSMLISGLYAAVFVVLGESVLEQDLTRTLAVVAVVVVLGGVMWWLRRRRGAALPD